MATVTGRVRGGLLLLAAFDLVVAWLTFRLGATSIMLFSIASAALLGLAALLAPTRPRALPALLVGVAVATFLRAIPQTGGAVDLGDVARYAVPVGFLLAAARRRVGPAWLPLAGVALVAVARSYFVAFYLAAGATTLVVGNVLGAAGAWLWATALLPGQADAPSEDAPSAG